MAEVSASMVKELRQQTGAGIMDCKNALVESDGDHDRALENIKKKGLAKVAKRAGAIAADGMIDAYIHAGSRLGVLTEVNCQTDFVARSDDFKTFVEAVGLQIASMGAQYVRRSEVPEADLAKQRELAAAQLADEANETGKKKPDNVVEKIIEGKLDKWLSGVCLEEQASVQDGDTTIGRMAEELSVKIGEKIAIRRFVRFEVGEGIEKKKVDLAAEVAATLSDS